ncbi:hypothetical protein L227DRAFT_515256 [Lentinus tigrinus ALCF2SS1-6]|uniref:BTB domain-containing protein n=1 Tax=Lentinus tigrinus ALCF2SS1-6 TaxID=1328759 RepID=A0A5C2RKU5_9APHY|nr:hypothetical protein L227DRAFT_515256 [Lentinus tigrinus ALCF2SS1-6]
MAEDYAKPSTDAEYSRHPHYYFQDGNLYILIEDVMFNVHRSILPSRDPSILWLGRSEDYPLRVKDVRRAAFELFLSLLYPFVPTEEAPRPRAVEDWVSVLDQSHRWGCERIRVIAVEQLSILPMDEVLKIAVWRKYGLDENDLLPCLQVLGTRDQPLTLTEGRLLELEMALRVSALRERVQQGLIAYTKQSSARPDLLDILPSQRVKELVCRALLPDFMNCGT